MSDFSHPFWSILIAVITLLGIFGCLLLLYITGKYKGPIHDDNTTGHVWDGDLREMNNPMPKWWMWLFVLSSIYGLVYLLVFPGLGSFQGSFNWTSLGEYEAEVKAQNKEIEPLYARFRNLPVESFSKDPQAVAIGERLFMNNCAQCHSSDARGGKGFPNLTDGDWLHGGTPDAIKTSITKGRTGVMPPMGAAVGNSDDVQNLANYVLSISGSPHDSVRAALGKSKFTACVSCHGVGGVGNQALGAPNLSDNIWLHGYGQEAIMAMVNNGKTNQMPAQEGKLTTDQIHLLTAYVWGLSR